MLTDAINEFRCIVRDAESPKPINHPDPTKTIVSVHGDVHTFDVPPDARNHEAYTLKSLCEMTSKAAAMQPGKPAPDNSVVGGGGTAVAIVDPSPSAYVSAEKVVVSIDDLSHRRDFVTCILDRHPFVRTLLGDELSGMTHSQFCKKLRDVTDQVVFDPEDFVKQISTIRFELNDNEDSSSGTRSDAMGRDIRAAATGIEDLPDEIKANVEPMPNDFSNESIDLRLALTFDAMNKRISLRLLETERVRLERWIREHVCEFIDKDGAANAFEGQFIAAE